MSALHARTFRRRALGAAFMLCALAGACGGGSSGPARGAPPPPPPAWACPDGPPICSQDRRLVIQCQRGGWVVLQSCGGGCSPGPGGAPACNAGATAAAAQTPQAGGAPCAGEGSYFCAADRAGLLVCRGGRTVLASTCRGPRGCVVGSAVACDHSLAALGDPCDDPGTIGCATDRKTMVRCQNGAFAASETCRNACLSVSGRVLCQ